MVAPMNRSADSSVDFRKAAAKLGPDIGHIATLLGLSLKNRAQQKSDRGGRRRHLSSADPCALAHCTTLEGTVIMTATPLVLKKVGVCSGAAKNQKVLANLVNQYPVSSQMKIPNFFEVA